MGPQVSFSEFVAWARILQVFTAQDLANAMAVDVAVAERGIKALTWHGSAEDTGDVIWDSPVGEERIFQYAPLPPGPKEHETPHTPMPWQLPPELADFRQILSPRGQPVRIRTERATRQNMSTPGARQKLKNAERAYQRQQEATRLRAEEQKKKAATQEPKWARKKVASKAVDQRLAA